MENVPEIAAKCTCKVSTIPWIPSLTGLSGSGDAFFGGCPAIILATIFVALNGTLGSYLRDALHGGRADDVACLPVPRAYVCRFFPPCSFILLCGSHCFFLLTYLSYM
jgi:hypothetical protein